MENKKFNNRHNNSYVVNTSKNSVVSFLRNFVISILKFLNLYTEKLVWESRSPALVGVIIAEFDTEEYVLIGKRGKGAADNHGRWNVPCGYLDWDESGYDGICREIFEETGLYIPDVLKGKYSHQNLLVSENHLNNPFYVNTQPTENRQNVSLSYGLYFVCDRLPELSIKYCEPDEVSEVMWMKLSQLDSYDFAFDHDVRIKYYMKMLTDNLKMKQWI